LAAIYRLDDNAIGNMYYIHKDHLGSFDKVTDKNGAIVDSYSFDAWGNRRDANNWTAPDNVPHLFARGFTGHEHLDIFGLINMNGRMYDPLLGRFLSPDPLVQAPDNPQNFNRYSYCLNNPLRYFDPSGFEYYDEYDMEYDGWVRDGMSVKWVEGADKDTKGWLGESFYFNDPFGNNWFFDSDGHYRNTTYDNLAIIEDWRIYGEFDDHSQDMDDNKNSEQPAGNFTYGDLSESFTHERTSSAKHQLPSQDGSSPENGALAEMLKALKDFIFGKDDSDKKVDTNPNNNLPDNHEKLPYEKLFVVDSLDWFGANSDSMMLYVGHDTLFRSIFDNREDWRGDWLRH